MTGFFAYFRVKVAGGDKLVFLVELHLKSSLITLMKVTKKQLRIGVVFVQPYASDAVDYLRPYFLLKRSTRPSA